jgi:hypothetical protein
MNGYPRTTGNIIGEIPLSEFLLAVLRNPRNLRTTSLVICAYLRVFASICA